jgi:mannitol-specific phosphotransferase system IIBC component
MNSNTAAPPRAALKKFGGPLTLAEFYGEDAYCTRFVEVHAAPFVSFAMYAEVMQTQTKSQSQFKDKDKYMFADKEKEKEKESKQDLMEDGIRQPFLRTDPISVQECTTQPSLLVKYLTKLALNSSLSEHENDNEKEKEKEKEKEDVSRREKKVRASKDKEKDKEKEKEKGTRKSKIDDMDDPQKSIHSKYLATSAASSDADDQIVKKVRKPRVSKINSDDHEVSKAPKNVLKRAKKMEMQDAAMGNKTRSLLSYAQKT